MDTEAATKVLLPRKGLPLLHPQSSKSISRHSNTRHPVSEAGIGILLWSSNKYFVLVVETKGTWRRGGLQERAAHLGASEISPRAVSRRDRAVD